MSSPAIVRKPTKSILSPLTRDYVIRTAQIILKAKSNLSKETIDIILDAHHNDPRRLAEHLNIALPVEVPRKLSKVDRQAMQT